jgi:hypothetical protein
MFPNSPSLLFEVPTLLQIIPFIMNVKRKKRKEKSLNMQIVKVLVPLMEPSQPALQDTSQGWYEVAGLEDALPYWGQCQPGPLHQDHHHHPLLGGALRCEQ